MEEAEKKEEQPEEEQGTMRMSSIKRTSELRKRQKLGLSGFVKGEIQNKYTTSENCVEGGGMKRNVFGGKIKVTLAMMEQEQTTRSLGEQMPWPSRQR